LSKKPLAPERLVDVLVQVEGGEDQDPRPLIDIGDDPAGGS
jgi:hypothetical protein